MLAQCFSEGFTHGVRQLAAITRALLCKLHQISSPCYWGFFSQPCMLACFSSTVQQFKSLPVFC